MSLNPTPSEQPKLDEDQKQGLIFLEGFLNAKSRVVETKASKRLECTYMAVCTYNGLLGSSINIFSVTNRSISVYLYFYTRPVSG